MKRIATMGLAALVLFLGACDEQAPTAPDGSEPTVFDPVFDMTGTPDGGECPEVYYQTTETLDNGVELTWTSAFGDFDYDNSIPETYIMSVMWSVEPGTATATYVGFTERRNDKATWTPRAKNDPVDGTMNPGAAVGSSVDVDVTMDPMHRGDEDVDGDGVYEWQGLIGNGHFWLILDVDDGAGNMESVKLGVNVHLEDPDEGFSWDDRCPT